MEIQVLICLSRNEHDNAINKNNYNGASIYSNRNDENAHLLEKIHYSKNKHNTHIHEWLCREDCVCSSKRMFKAMTQA